MAAPKGNKFALGNNGGKPPIYSDVDILTNRIDEYFNSLYNQEAELIETPRVNSLALFLGFSSKQSLYDYSKKEEFSYPIKRALTCIEDYHESGLGSKNATGHIFALKNSGWKDKVEQEISGKGGVPNIVVNLGSGINPEKSEPND